MSRRPASRVLRRPKRRAPALTPEQRESLETLRRVPLVIYELRTKKRSQPYEAKLHTQRRINRVMVEARELEAEGRRDGWLPSDFDLDAAIEAFAQPEDAPEQVPEVTVPGKVLRRLSRGPRSKAPSDTRTLALGVDDIEEDTETSIVDASHPKHQHFVPSSTRDRPLPVREGDRSSPYPLFSDDDSPETELSESSDSALGLLRPRASEPAPAAVPLPLPSTPPAPPGPAAAPALPPPARVVVPVQAPGTAAVESPVPADDLVDEVGAIGEGEPPPFDVALRQATIVPEELSGEETHIRGPEASSGPKPDRNLELVAARRKDPRDLRRPTTRGDLGVSARMGLTARRCWNQVLEGLRFKTTPPDDR